MAISTEQFEIPMVRFPILEAATHNVPTAFGALFFRRILVVNIETSEVTNTAFYTRTTKGLHQFEFACPFGFLMAIVSVVPCPLAFERAEAYGTWLSALLALSILMPSMGKITFSAAILSGLLFQAIDVHGNRLAAMLADYLYGFVSHGSIISQYMGSDKPRYFDIACKRIAREYEQLKLFPPEERREAKRLDLDTGAGSW